MCYADTAVCSSSKVPPGSAKSTLLHALGEHATDYGVQTYRKLGIASRDELAPAMAAYAT